MTLTLNLTLTGVIILMLTYQVHRTWYNIVLLIYLSIFHKQLYIYSQYGYTEGIKVSHTNCECLLTVTDSYLSLTPVIILIQILSAFQSTSCQPPHSFLMNHDFINEKPDINYQGLLVLYHNVL